MRKLYIVIIVVGLVLIGGFLGLRYYLQPSAKNVYALPAEKKENYSDLDMRPLIAAKLKDIIREGSYGLYDFTLDSLTIDLVNSKIEIFNPALRSKNELISQLDKEQKLPDEIYNITCQSLVIEGANVDDIVTMNTIDLSKVRIVKPDIKITSKKRPYNAGQRLKDEQFSIHERIANLAKKISVNQLAIQEATLTTTNLQTNKTKKLSNLDIQLNDILIDSTTRNDNKRFLFAKEAIIKTKNYAYRTPDSLYLFTAKNISIEAPSHTMSISGIVFTPRLSKQAFQKKLKHSKERYDINVPNITLQKIDWWQFFNDDVFAAENASLSSANVSVYFDRTLPPPPSKVGNFPHQLLMQLKMLIYIKKMNFSNVDLKYEEFNPTSGKKGEVILQNIQGTAFNITNMKQHIAANNKMQVQTSSMLFQKIPLRVNFSFDLQRYKNGNFTADVSIGSVDGNTLNKIAEPLGLLSIDKGSVQKLSAKVSGSNTAGKGSILLLYNDLNISVLKKDETKKSGLKEKEILGFFANTFVIKDENPSKKEQPRVANVTFERDVQTGFFNLAWKTVLAGILETIGASQNLAKRKK